AQKVLLEQIAAEAGAVVTMTDIARHRLVAGYHVDPAKVSVIPHGASKHASTPSSGARHRPHLLTWGLLGPGKGIEWALRALAEALRRLLTESALAATLTNRIRTDTATLSWPAVAARYEALAHRLLAAQRPAAAVA